MKRFFLSVLCLAFCGAAGFSFYLRWHYGAVGSDLEKERARAKRNGIRLDTEDFVRTVSDDRNAAIDFRAAVAKLNGFPERERKAALRLARELADGGLPSNDADLVALRRVQNAVLPDAERAAAKSDCEFGRDWSDPITSPFPEYQQIRDLERLCRARAVLRAQGGQFKSAFDDLRTSLKLSEHAGREPTVIAALVRTGGRGGVVRLAAKLLSLMPARKFEGVLLLDRILPDLKIEHEPLEALCGEPYFGVYLARNLEKYAGEAGKIIGNSSDEDGQIHWERYAFLPPFQDPERVGAAYETQLLKFWNGIFEDYQKEKWSPDQLSAALDQQSRAAGEGDFATRYFMTVVFPVFAGWGDVAMRDRASVALTLAARDVLLYGSRNGKFPAALAEASKAIDPYDGKPLRYRRTEDGFILYSVGRDRVDNGGQPRAKSFRPGGENQFDEVFRVGGAEAKLADLPAKRA